MKNLLLAISLTSIALCAQALEKAALEELGLPASLKDKMQTIIECTPPEQPTLTTRFTKLKAAALNQNLLLLNLEFAQKPDFNTSSLIIYLDIDDNLDTGRKDKYHTGVDIMLVLSGSDLNLRDINIDRKVIPPKVAISPQQNNIAILLSANFKCLDNQLNFQCRLLAENKTNHPKILAQASDKTSVKLPILPGIDTTKLKLERSASLIPLSYYGFYNEKIALLPLENKGLKASQVIPKGEPFKHGRPTPILKFMPDDNLQKSAQATTIPIVLREEAGTPRTQAPVSFGFPTPKARLFSTTQIKLIDESGSQIQSQADIMNRWDDGSIRWTNIKAAFDFKPNQTKTVTIKIGEDNTQPQKSNLLVKQENGIINISTGKLDATINTNAFSFATLTAKGKQPLELIAILKDEQGKQHSTRNLKPESVRIESTGPQKATIRIQGNYADQEGSPLFTYIARLSFFADSPLIDLEWTTINTALANEFTDVTSLELKLNIKDATDLTVAKNTKDNAFDLATAQLQGHPLLKAAQWDDQTAEASTQFWPSLPKGTRLVGVCQVTAKDSKVGIAVQDFWQRWPKEFALDNDGLTIGILPTQPSKDFGKTLPYYLLYPFLEGKYRAKWGMAFTERITIDPSGTISLDQLIADRDCQIVPVIPAEWYNETKVFGHVSVPKGTQFKAWDIWFEKQYDAELRRREQQREYGYFNLGDSFGERGRNWTNNEYDPAHGLFMQFVRTGETKYFRLAMQIARHQADVDIVNAYPDPYYIGANHQHSIGHTGQWSQHHHRATWTHKYDYHTDAQNGHTWTEGMADAWCLAADPRPYESSVLLGEHIVWGMSHKIKKLGTHERSAGWSVKAILCLYRYLGDPLYLEAGKRIVEIALQEQKFDQGGAWPHVLPGDHQGKQPGAVGNALFLVGVVVSGIKDYYEVTGDPRAAKSIVAACEWIMKSYDPDLCGWPYTARVDGMPLWDIGPGGSPMLPQPVAFAGLLTGDKRFIDAAHDTIETMLFRARGSSGKAFGSNTLMMHNALGIIQEWYQKHKPDQVDTLLSENLERKMILKTKPAKSLRSRAPNIKTFLVKINTQNPTASIVRTPTGAMPKRNENSSVLVKDKNGNTIQEFTCSTDVEKTFEAKLQGNPGDVFTIQVDDDQRAHWHVAGPDIKAMAVLTDKSTLASVGSAKYFIDVPEGTRQFKVKLTGIHRGHYQCIIQDSNGNLVFEFQGEHFGDAQIVTLKGVQNSSWHDVDCSKAAFGKPWSIILSAAQDIGVEFQGIPPNLAISPDQIFQP